MFSMFIGRKYSIQAIHASKSTSPLWYSIKRASTNIIVLSSYSAYGKYYLTSISWTCLAGSLWSNWKYNVVQVNILHNIVGLSKNSRRLTESRLRGYLFCFTLHGTTVTTAITWKVKAWEWYLSPDFCRTRLTWCCSFLWTLGRPLISILWNCILEQIYTSWLMVYITCTIL